MARSVKDLKGSAERRRKAFVMREQGASFQAIADALGFSSRGAACSAVKVEREAREGASGGVGTAEAYETEAARLDVVIASLSPAVERGEPASVNAYLRAIARRTEVSGLIAAGQAPVVPVAAPKTPLDELRERRAARAADGRPDR